MPFPDEEPRRASGTAFLVAVALLIALAIAYVASLRGLQEDAVHREAIYNPDRAVPEAYLQINASVTRVDLLQRSIMLRLSFTPKGGLATADGRAAKQDIRLTWPGPDGIHDALLRAGQRPSPVFVSLALDGLDLESGEIAEYPLDRYRSRFEISAQGASGPATAAVPSARVPVILVLDAASYGIHVDSKLLPESQSGAVAIDLAISRSRVAMALVFCMGGGIAILTLASVLLASVVALGRRVDFPMVIWTGLLLLIFPAIRMVLPGTPPLGIMADTLVFFWALLLVMLSMAVLVFSWLRRAED